MYFRNPRLRPRIAAIVAGLLTALGSAFVVASPASAATTVSKENYKSVSTGGFTNTTSPDGCSSTSTAASAGTSSQGDGGSTMYYSSSTYDRCTAQSHSVHGSGPTQAFAFDHNSVHAIATVPLSDGTQIYLDLTWHGTGTVERNATATRDVQPGQFVGHTAVHVTLQDAVVTGTLSLDNAYIAATKVSSLAVTIGKP